MEGGEVIIILERDFSTVIVQEAVFPPSVVVTVMVAVPGALAVTTPFALTCATEVLLDFQLTVLVVAFDGVIVATRV